MTRNLIGDDELRTMPVDSVLINASRGGVVDTDALVSALRWSKIRGAALDVTHPEPLPDDHPLWNLENCLITPHIGGHTPQFWNRMVDILVHNVNALDTGGTLQNEVQTTAP